MIKRVISATLVFAFAVVLCSCGKPDKMSDAMYQIGINALTTADEYIEGKISGKEAQEKIDEFYIQAEAQYKKECKDVGADNLVQTDIWRDSSVETYVSLLNISVKSASQGYSAMSDVKKQRDNLAETLGK